MPGNSQTYNGWVVSLTTKPDKDISDISSALVVITGHLSDCLETALPAGAAERRDAAETSIYLWNVSLWDCNKRFFLCPGLTLFSKCLGFIKTTTEGPLPMGSTIKPRRLCGLLENPELDGK